MHRLGGLNLSTSSHVVLRSFTYSNNDVKHENTSLVFLHDLYKKELLLSHSKDFPPSFERAKMLSSVDKDRDKDRNKDRDKDRDNRLAEGLIFVETLTSHAKKVASMGLSLNVNASMLDIDLGDDYIIEEEERTAIEKFVNRPTFYESEGEGEEGEGENSDMTTTATISLKDRYSFANVEAAFLQSKLSVSVSASKSSNFQSSSDSSSSTSASLDLSSAGVTVVNVDKSDLVLTKISKSDVVKAQLKELLVWFRQEFPYYYSQCGHVPSTSKSTSKSKSTSEITSTREITSTSETISEESSKRQISQISQISQINQKSQKSGTGTETGTEEETGPGTGPGIKEGPGTEEETGPGTGPGTETGTVGPLSCTNGQKDGNEYLGFVYPSLREREEGRAGGTELFLCVSCRQVTRFPRFHRAQAILDSQKGRCGEYVIVFFRSCLEPAVTITLYCCCYIICGALGNPELLLCYPTVTLAYHITIILIYLPSFKH